MTEGHEELPVWCAGEEWCPITATASIIGKKWHPVIIHRLLQNQDIGFNALKREVDGISSKVLSESLEDLQQKELVRKKVVSEDPKRVKYRLSEKGESLEPVIMEMLDWGQKNLSKPDQTEDFEVSIK